MGPRGGRRHGGRKAHKSGGSWPIVFVFLVMALIWVVATIVILPRELNGIKDAIRSDEEVRDGRRIPLAPSLPPSWSSSPYAAADFPVLPRRVRPDKNRPRAEIDMDTIVRRMRSFLDELDSKFRNLPNPEPYKIWDLYKAAADKWLLPMDREHEAQTLFEVREDETIFVSVASYRDENCPKTLTEMFSKARRPQNVYIGLVQQNCVSGCRTGVLEGGVVKDTEPDINCYEEFCASGIGAPYCEAGNVRNFFVDEAGSLGPAVARYFASKLWKGENFFMQIDAHSLFESDWDAMLVQDIHNTPSYPRSVLSHYPPDTKANYRNQPGYRICGAEFAKSQVEYDIVRLGAGISQDRQMQAKPCPAPFVGAGFFFAHAEFLADVPFDPYVPWVFMGEEILVSLRMWTWGYDIYSPTRNVLSHFYVRRHTPKFWETVNRLFHKPTIHNDITRMLINRVKNIAGYPESSADILMMPSLLAELDLYGEGDVRAMEDYLDIVGLDMVSKRTKTIEWCTKCQMPYPL